VGILPVVFLGSPRSSAPLDASGSAATMAIPDEMDGRDGTEEMVDFCHGVRVVQLVHNMERLQAS